MYNARCIRNSNYITFKLLHSLELTWINIKHQVRTFYNINKNKYTVYFTCLPNMYMIY